MLFGVLPVCGAVLVGCAPASPAAGSYPAVTVDAPQQLPLLSLSVPPAPSPVVLPSTAPGALAALQSMPVKPAAASNPFDAAMFGAPDWLPSGCNTDDLVLKRDLVGAAKVSASSCLIASGHLFDPYSATWLWYSRFKQFNQVAVDQVVPFAAAWTTGASIWTPDSRRRFANDPLELRATGISQIAAKARRDATGWLPPNAAGACAYVVDQVAIKTKYRLWVTPAEKTSMLRVLSHCPPRAAWPTPTAPPPPPPSRTPKA